MAKTLPDLLNERVRLMAYAIVRYGPMRGSKKYDWWAGYDWHQPIHVNSWSDNDIDYRRKRGASPRIHISNVQPSGVKNSKESEPALLNTKTIDAATIRVRNADGETEQPWGPYTGEFEVTQTKRHAFEKGFEQSVRNCFTAGNDNTYVKNELEVTLGFSQTETDEEEKAERVNRVFNYNGVTPAGKNERITAWRKVGKMKSIVTGQGDYTFSFEIGRHWHHRWQGGHYKWETQADFLRCLRGEAPSGWAGANEFRQNRVPSWLIDRISKPLDLPYTQVLEFDQATDIDLRKESF